MNYGTTIRKLTQPHLFTNNMFPPINAHSRPPSEDLRGLPNQSSESPTGSKQQPFQPAQVRRQQPIDQNRRSPLRIIYRSNDYAWNDHPAPHQPLRAASPLKNKMTTSARQLANGILHENAVPIATSSMMHLPTSSSPIVGQQETHNGDYFLASASKSRHANRLQRTNSHLDNKGIPSTYALPLRSDSYRSTNLEFGLRPRHTSSKQRSYVNSKASSHEMNNAEGYVANGTDESPIGSGTVNNTTQRLNVSSFDLTTSRKSLSPNKSISFNGPAAHHPYHTSTHDLHRSDTNIERNNLTRFALRGTVSKEHPVTTTSTTPAAAAPVIAAKQRQTSSFPVSNTPGVALGQNSTGERHPSAQSYKSRDPNLSYAYTDVKKYIEENDLMSPEKEQIIRHWVLDVEKHRHQMQKID